MQDAARLEYPIDLGEYPLFIGAEVKHPVTDDRVGPIIFDGYFLDKALSELDLLQLHCPSSCARLFEHLLGHIDADDASGLCNLTRSDEAIEART